MLRSAIGILLFITASASAQIVYQPVEYEYRVGDTIYYYGGDDPRVHATAAELSAPDSVWGRVNGYAFTSSSLRSQRSVEFEPLRVFSDSWHHGLQNASAVGFTVDDARNEAYARAPRYFRKRDLLRAAVPQADGSWLVPAHAAGVAIYKSDGRLIASPAARTAPPLMILPRSPLHQPSNEPQTPAVALNR